MLEIKKFMLVILAFFSLCVGASLMQRAVHELPGEAFNKALTKAEPSCRVLMRKHQDNITKKVAQEIYQDAITYSFNGEWSKAEEASECAAWLEHGTKKWNFEAKDLIN